jgi:gamma-aminobutyric acid type B receptor
MHAEQNLNCLEITIFGFDSTALSFAGLLLLFGIFFTWETRKVTIEALNDSKQIGLCIYNVMVMSTITLPLVSLLSADQVSISFGVFSVAVLLCTTTTLSLVFGPKVRD